MASEEHDTEREKYLKKYLHGEHSVESANNRRNGPEEEIRTTPLFSLTVKDAVEQAYGGPGRILPQYGLLGFHIGTDEHISDEEPIFMNVAAPNSTFICGSQGSGKSFTLSTMLENCLLSDNSRGRLVNPISALVFHFDADSSGSIAEAAYLCSCGIETRVILSESNSKPLGDKYSSLPGAAKHLSVDTMKLNSKHMTVKSMMNLMSFSEQGGQGPLYMQVIHKILREMAVESKGAPFDYQLFKARLENETFTQYQTGPLKLRLDLLESFLEMPGKWKTQKSKDLFDLKPGTLTIVDLSDPFVDRATACVLFDITLHLAISNAISSGTGLVLALDEAHRFMDESQAATDFASSLLTAVRMQRHIATRVIVATQEPTISPALLDLCSVSIVHCFKSPEWFKSIEKHLGGASKFMLSLDKQHEMFNRIMTLRVGESLVFAPSSFLCSEEGKPKKLEGRIMKMKTRQRPNVNDGGVSVLAREDSNATNGLVEAIDELGALSLR